MVHLHVRSWFSFQAGGSSPEALAARAAELGMPALALTDRHGVYGAVRFQQACEEVGVRPIFGAEVTVGAHPLVFLAKSRDGYATLNRLLGRAHGAERDRHSSGRNGHDRDSNRNSTGRDDREQGSGSSPEGPVLPTEELEAYTQDLVCLSGGREGRLARLVEEKRRAEARRWLDRLKGLFGEDLFVELTHHRRPGDRRLVRQLYELAEAENCSVVATGDVRYAQPEAYRRYDLLTCARKGITVFEDDPDRPFNDRAYLSRRATLEKRIPYPEAFANTRRVAERCRVDLLPELITPPSARVPGDRDPHRHLRTLCQEALSEKYPSEEQGRAFDQLHEELGVIEDLDLADYFLVVREVVEEAQRRGIRCAGRGSAANSLVAYLLDITKVDPIEHGLLFERFLHRGRKGTPDIDIDFDAERREEIIAWMEERFGHEQTAMTATLITYRLRSALRDVAKALGWPLDTVNELTSAVPRRGAGAVANYRAELERVVGDSPLFEKLLAMTASLEGCPRHLGLHNGGMVLSSAPLERFTPVQTSANGVTMVQFDKRDVEALGLVKLDVLGLRMFASVSEATELINRYEDPDFDPDDLALDDEPTYEMMRASKTLGVFQIESQGQIHLLAKHQPENFQDLITEIALFRPGPVQGNMVDPFVRRRQSEEPVTYDHPDLEPILEDTYGIILFQEQVLEVAHRFAGLSLQEADDFRAYMSKFRDPGAMEEMRDRFVGGATGRGVDPEIAHHVFDQIAHFVGYGFCRSHAAAFAQTVYQSAYLKRHHPAAFLAAVMQHRPGMYGQMTLEEEARRFDVPVLLPDVHRSGLRFDLERLPGEAVDPPAGPLAIRKPLTVIDQLSEQEARSIVWERMREPFSSVEDLYRRVSVSRDALEALARSGALNELAGSSREALWEIGVLANRLGPAGPSDQPSLFDVPAVTAADVPELSELELDERLSWDYQTHRAARIHPMHLFRRSLTDLEIRPVELCYRITEETFPDATEPEPIVTTAGLVILRQRPSSANGVMFLTVEDETGFIQCVVFPQYQEQLGEILTRSALIVRGRLQMKENWRGLILTDAWVLDEAFGGYVGHPSSSGGRDRWMRRPKSRRARLRNPEAS